MLYPSDDDRGVLTAVLVDLENIHGNTVSKFFCCYRALRGSKRTVIGTRQLIRGN